MDMDMDMGRGRGMSRVGVSDRNQKNRAAEGWSGKSWC